ncbi:hypothetical protein BH09SUM1_BH09SUM1_09710 [soil metagenome]
MALTFYDKKSCWEWMRLRADSGPSAPARERIDSIILSYAQFLCEMEGENYESAALLYQKRNSDLTLVSEVEDYFERLEEMGFRVGAAKAAAPVPGNLLRAGPNPLLPRQGKLGLRIELDPAVEVVHAMVSHGAGDESPELLKRGARNHFSFPASLFGQDEGVVIPASPRTRVALWPEVEGEVLGAPLILTWEGTIVGYDWKPGELRNALLTFVSSSPVKLPDLNLVWHLRNGSRTAPSKLDGFQIERSHEETIPMRSGANELIVQVDNISDPRWHSIALRHSPGLTRLDEV